MSSKHNTNFDSLRWVVLLLAAAVILPTVCLLWFMTQAVKNERLAVRQKLIDFYTARANQLILTVQGDYFSNLLHQYDDEIGHPGVFFDSFAACPSDNIYQGALIYASTADLIYPQFEFLNVDTTQPTIEPLPNLHLETTERIYELCYPENPEEISPSRAADIMRYRVFLAKRYHETKDPALIYHLRKMLINRKDNLDKEHWFLDGPAETTVWQLEKMIEIAQDSGLESRLGVEIQSARTRIIAYNNAIEIGSLYPSAVSLQDWPNQTIRRLSPESEYYGFKFNVADKTILGISTFDRMLPLLAASIMNIQDDTVEVHISDNYGHVIIGDETIVDKPFLRLKAGKFLPDFTVSLSFKDDSVFEKAAQRQTAIYTWTGILVVGLMLLAGVVAIGTVGRQMRMNRLKNDFIATVTHELKTPLSSMRLLVDTLLDGNYTNQQQCKEYLELISRENHRLSRMIDSFLTFSRMERGKQVFEMASVNPGQIVQAAVEAVQTKFNAKKCEFSVTVDDGLPSIYADKDAMVTAVVNLLDNACKYSGDEKRIELNVYLDSVGTAHPTGRIKNGCVCFAVRDNGIGMTRRQSRRIFEKFYQVDSSLSRQAEGCGLGLSIVKYIVDAHKGTIEVESKVGNGSEFIIQIPIVIE